MKKIFSFLTAILFVGSLWATDATMAGGSAVTVNGKSAIKVGASKSGGSMTITVGSGASSLSFYIASWSGDAASVSVAPADNVETTALSPTEDASFSGSGSSFTLTNDESTYYTTINLKNINEETVITLSCSSGKNRFIVWGATYETSGGGGSSSVKTPTFDPDGGNFVGSVEVTLTQEDSKAIYYTTNGNDPTTDGTLYENPFTLTATTTVKAAAKDGDDWSSVVTKTFTRATPTLTLTPATKSVAATNVAKQSITLTATNFVNAISSVTTGLYSDAECNTPITSEGAWVKDITVNEGKTAVTFNVDDNDDIQRICWLKITASDGSESADAILQITQAKYEAPAALPFAFDSGKSDIASTNGLKHSGLGSDYGSSPKLKFDGTGDYLILWFNEAPGTLTFDIKGNGFSGGTFKVQTSVDGETYTDLETYTKVLEDGAKHSESFSEISSSVRFIKWIYTDKSDGNVALGKIALAKSSTTAIENTEAGVKAVKVLREGQIFILRGEKVYTVQGQLVK